MLDGPKPRTRGSLLPLLVMLLLFLVADALLLILDYFRFYSFRNSDLVGYGFAGIAQAQAGIFCVLGGAVGRSWISSFLRTMALAVTSVLLFLGVEVWDSYDHLPEATILACGIIPPLLFCGCIPFLALRGLYGWHLTRCTSELDESYSLRIEDFFMAMVVIAGLLATAPPAASFANPNGGDEVLPMLMIAAASFVGASAVAVMPVCMVCFRESTWRRRAAVLSFFAFLGLAASSVVVVGYQLWIGLDNVSALRSSLPVMYYLGTSAVVFSLGLVVLHWSGYRWGTIAKESRPSEPIDPLAEHKPLVASAGSFRKKNRVAAAGIVLASIAITVTISHFKDQRLRLAQRLQKLNTEFLLEGGYVVHQDHDALFLRVPPSKLDSSLDLSQFTRLTTLALSGTQLTESTLHSIRKMNSLLNVDLSHTSFADSAVKNLMHRDYLQRLSLAGTQVTVTGINEITARVRIFGELDIGDLNLDDAAIKELLDPKKQMLNVNGLILRGNPITDKSLAHLASVNYLDLSGTKCDGSALGQLTQVQSLFLDGTLVDDAGIAQLFASNSVLKRLSIRNTLVTDAMLNTLSQYPSLTELELGDGEITAEGLEAVAFAPSDRLALNSQKFTGKLFATWRPTIRRLDMSHSGVNDSDVHQLANVWNLQVLSLAHCDITDESIEKLAGMNLLKIDLTGTKVTATAAAKLFPESTVVYVSAAQCSPQELAQANSLSRLRIGIPFDDTNY